MIRHAALLVAASLAGCVTIEADRSVAEAAAASDRLAGLSHRDRKDAATYALQCAYAYSVVSAEAEEAGRWNVANEADSRLGWFVDFANDLELSSRELNLARGAARERVLALPLTELASTQGASCSDFYARWGSVAEPTSDSAAPPAPGI